MRRRHLAVGAAAVATIWSVVLPAIAVDTLDVNPGWQQTSGYASGGSVKYTQKLQHLNSSASDTATTKVNGGSPYSP